MTRNVLITGATKGIGLATSKILAEQGYRVIGIARNIKDVKFPGVLFECDLGDREQTSQVIERIKEEFKLYAIVNNVGIALPQPLGQINLNDLDQVYDLNVRSAVQITQAFMDDIEQGHLERIVNISSRAFLGLKDRSSYAAAKSALIGLTRTWALELAKFEVTVNAIAPGGVETELFRKTRPVGSLEEAKVIEDIPLKRIGKPREIASAIAFLLSEDSGFITGQTICIDGGASL